MAQDYDKKVKAIDRWIQRIVRHAWIRTILFFVALLEVTISPLLPEIVVAAILAYRKDISWKVLSIISALGSAVGAGLLYIAGKFLYSQYQTLFDSWLGNESIVKYTDIILAQNTFFAIFFAAFTPIPDRIAALLSGVLSLSFVTVVLAFFFGRLLRVGIVAYFSARYGDDAREYILKHTMRVTVMLIILLILYVSLKIGGIL